MKKTKDKYKKKHTTNKCLIQNDDYFYRDNEMARPTIQKDV